MGELKRSSIFLPIFERLLCRLFHFTYSPIKHVPGGSLALLNRSNREAKLTSECREKEKGEKETSLIIFFVAWYILWSVIQTAPHLTFTACLGRHFFTHFTVEET